MSIILPEWLQQIKQQHVAWFSEFQQAQWNAFAALGLPDRKNERWKYTDIAFLNNASFSPAERIDASRLHHVIHQHRLQHGDSILLVVINGYFMPELSDIHKLPSQFFVCRLSQAIKTHAELIKKGLSCFIDAKKYPFASLNAALSSDGLIFSLPDHCELNAPIHLLSMVTDEKAFSAHPYHIFLLGEESRITLVEEYFSQTDQAYMMNVVNSFFVGKNAQLDYYKIQHEGKEAIHIAHTFIQQWQNSNVTLTNFSAGGLFARDEVAVYLKEQGADCRTHGFYHLQNDHQYIDHHIDIDHVAPHSHSEMLYKGILENKSRAVFNGRLHVEKNAQKITAHQANHNILLSNQAEVYAKPELEIYADDVKCKHGATTGQLDQDALFYLCSRGISKEEATHILLMGFAEEVMQRVTHRGIKMRVQELVSL